ncbi:DUF1854 domain-containing protein [Thiocystis violascens]|uniref:DUF1854 domain-containing protein n=1 Tax=Thiocystis violascens (strain ATCC 17096 / DSM 198 / 6111) TaxID=765911 RepID=I3Y571_THIV6|nr:DUF1854 domain-containing protein [Thiocystis violascens]AFL72139.1 protein of unknown function (DUF1854) [Thiocystis violascens DSM 198]
MTTSQKTPQHPLDFHLCINPFGRLTYIDATGVEHQDAIPVRAYPLSDPRRWVTICDHEGRELRCIEDLAILPPDVRATLEDELAHREFVPRILRVIQVSSYLEPAEWEVETDCGPTRFVLKTEEDVRRLGPHSALILDSHGVRYLVPDTRDLTPYGRRAVDRYL